MGTTGQVSTKLSPRMSGGRDWAKLLGKWYFRPCAGWDRTQEAFQGAGASPAKAQRTMSFPGIIVHVSWGQATGAEGGLMSHHRRSVYN